MTIQELKELAEVLSKLKQDNLDIDINVTIKSKGIPQIYYPDWTWSPFEDSGKKYWFPGTITCSNVNSGSVKIETKTKQNK